MSSRTTREGGGGPLGRLLDVRGGEWGALGLSGLFFFLLLFGYFLLRPVREAMGVAGGLDALAWLFGVTCAVSLGAALAFGGLVSRMDRARCIAWAYRGVIACLLVFAGLRLGFGDGVRLWTGYVFYVWLSVVNVFMVSVFWAFMADVWRLEQGKRLYAAVGVGGTLGAFFGALFAWRMVEDIGAPAQMLLAAVMFEGAVRAMRALHRRSARGEGDIRPHRPHALGGSWAEGARAVAGSPYLMGVGAYIVLIAVSGTLLYFAQAAIVSGAEEELTARIALFGQLDMWTQAATLAVQVFVTGRLMRRAGVGVTLGVLPVVTVAGFACLALAGSRPGVEGWQVFAVFAAFNALHRATRYAVARPARETLFSVVSEREKYKAKPVVDVFLFRGGDVAGMGVSALIGSAALGLAGLAMAAAPLGVLWVLLSVWLARGQRERATARAELDSGSGIVPGGAAV